MQHHTLQYQAIRFNTIHYNTKPYDATPFLTIPDRSTNTSTQRAMPSITQLYHIIYNVSKEQPARMRCPWPPCNHHSCQSSLEGTLVERDKKVKKQEGAILGFQNHKITVNFQLKRAERILSFLQSSLISTVESFKRDVNLGQMGDALPNGSVQGGCPWKGKQRKDEV